MDELVRGEYFFDDFFLPVLEDTITGAIFFGMEMKRGGRKRVWGGSSR